MSQSLDIIVAGHICLDITPALPGAMEGRFGEMMLPGRLINVGPATLSTGGAVANTGLALVRLGLRARLMGKIGDDLFGHCIQSIMSSEGAGGGMVVVPGEHTSYSVVIAPPGTDRIFLHNPGANDTCSSADIDFEAVAGARLFHLGYPPLMRRLYLDGGAELIAIYRRVKELGLTTSLDMSLPDPNSESGQVDWRVVLERLLPHVDLPLLSAEEAMFMLDRERFEALKARAAVGSPLDFYNEDDIAWLPDELLHLGCAVAVIKCGPRGLYLRSAGMERLARAGRALPPDGEEWADRELFEEVFHVKNVVSATGAGDATIAGFLAALLRGFGPARCLRVGCCVGAQCVQTFDALSGIHGWEETLAMIPGWLKSRQTLTGEWTWDEAQKIWRGARDRCTKIHEYK